jgi:hypothetical protein
MSETAVWPRLFAGVGALALGTIALVIVVVLGHRTPGPASTSAAAPATPAPSTTPSGTAPPQNVYPAPAKGGVVFSREDGSNILALAVVPGKELGLQASIVGEQGEGVRGAKVSFDVDGTRRQAVACGEGCYRATAAVAGAPKRVVVHVVHEDGSVTTWPVTVPAQWPPPNASSIVARATRTYKDLKTLVIHDRLASDPKHFVVTRWQIVGPNKLSYQVTDGAAAVIIGNHRWDKVPGQPWQRSAQTPIKQPTPFWVSWQNAHVLSSTPTTWTVSFFDPKTPGWYKLTIAKPTMRPLEMHMNATAHFMHDVYSGFNTPITISPPSQAR